MIQRVQTIYLLFMILVVGVMFFVPMAVYNTSAGTVIWNLSGFSPTDILQSSTIMNLPAVLSLIVGIASLLIVLQYRNRMLQIRLCRINMIVMILFIASLFYVVDSVKDQQDVVRFAYMYGAYLSVFLPVLNYLSMGAIRRDEMKVKAADRLR
jgi:hypothetical protein